MTSTAFDTVASSLVNATLTPDMYNATTGTSRSMSFEDRERIEYIKHVLMAMKNSYMWVIFAVGFPGNLMSLLVILRIRGLGSPALYVATLAVVDNVAIAVKLMLVLFGQHKVSLGAAGCKVMFFLGNFLVVYANWVLITMAVERFFAVWKPLHVTRKWTLRKAAISLVVVLLVTGTYVSPLFVTVTARRRGCSTFPQYAQFMSAWQWGQVVAYGFLPCTLLLAINIAIIVLIGRARRFQRTMTTSSANKHTPAKNNNRPTSPGGVQRQATLLLLVTSAVLVLTTTPICVYLVAQQWWRPERGSVEAAEKALVGFVVRVVCDCNHSVNFYLYFISARKFRAYFVKTVCCLFGRDDDRRGSEVLTRHFSTSRSTLRAKDRSQSNLPLCPRGSKRDSGGKGENDVHMKLYTEDDRPCTDNAVCSSRL